MRFRKVKPSDKVSNVVIEHAGEELTWDVKILERGNKNSNKNKDPNAEEILPADPFEQINQYFYQMPLQKQDDLFDVYKEINHILQPHVHDSIQDLRKRLPPLFKKIFQIIPPDSMAHWVSTTPTIVFPADIRVYDTHEESAEKGENFGLRSRPADATYIKPDYWGLVVTVLLARLVVPIWGNFLTNIDPHVNNHYKEIFALRLAMRSALVDSDGYLRLQAYINRYLSPEKFKNSAMEGSVPKEDAPLQTLAILIVRRLAWADVSGRIPNFSLIGRVYSFIDQHLDGADRQYNERVKPKIPDNGMGGSDQENRASVSELIKIREPYPAGDLTLPEATARTPAIFIERMHPEMGPDWLALGLATVKPLYENTKRPLQIQFTMLQNVCGAECIQRDGQWEVDPRFRERWDAFFPPRAIDDMDLVEDLNMMAVGAALLCYRGFYDIAALMTATPLRDRQGHSIGTSPPPVELTDENKRLLAQHYPYAQRPGSRKRVDDPRLNKLPNVASQLIDTIAEELVKYQWVLNLPPAWLAQLPNHDGQKRYMVKSDFRNRFAELATAIATRTL